MATLTAIRPAEAIPVMRMAIQRTASISEIVVDGNTRTHAGVHLRVACIAANPLLRGYTGYAGYDDDLAAFLV